MPAQLTKDGTTDSCKEPHRGTAVRWADDMHGDSNLSSPIATVHSVPYEIPALIRVLILMLDPIQRKFEFVQCEISSEEPLKVSHVLEQLPGLCVDKMFRRRRFTALCHQGAELLNMISVTEFVSDGDMLIAVPEGIAPKEAMQASSSLLRQRDLVKTLRKGAMTGRALKRLLSSQDWVKETAKEVSMDTLEQKLANLLNMQSNLKLVSATHANRS